MQSMTQNMQCKYFRLKYSVERDDGGSAESLPPPRAQCQFASLLDGSFDLTGARHAAKETSTQRAARVNITRQTAGTILHTEHSVSCKYHCRKIVTDCQKLHQYIQNPEI